MKLSVVDLVVVILKIWGHAMSVEITWTNCAEQMPPDIEIIIQYKNDQPKLFDGSRFTESFVRILPDIIRNTKWTEYTPEKWKEINKCAD